MLERCPCVDKLIFGTTILWTVRNNINEDKLNKSRSIHYSWVKKKRMYFQNE